MPTQNDMVYTAGLLDGEGTFGLYKLRKDRLRISGSVQCTLVYKPTIEWLKETFKGSLWETKLNKKNPKWRNSWQWSCQGEEAYILCDQIIPYLKEKKEQAELLMNFFSWRNNQPYQANWAEAYWMVDKMKELKHA